MQLGKFQHVLRTQHRVVSTAAFGDVVEQGGNQDQFRMGEARPQFDAQWKRSNCICPTMCDHCGI